MINDGTLKKHPAVENIYIEQNIEVKLVLKSGELNFTYLIYLELKSKKCFNF